MLQRQFHAPQGNGEILSVPAFSDLPKLVESNRQLLESADIRISGLPLKTIRFDARREVLALCGYRGSSNGPLLLTGHQPELFHPGVWIKNFFVNGLARQLGGIPLNLIVDNDTLKSTALRFPTFRDGDAGSVHATPLHFDVFTGEMPYEDRVILDRELFHCFPERAASLWQNWGYEPLLPTVWRERRTIAESFVTARRECEEAWGCRNLELSVSRVADTEAFQRFAGHIFENLERFQKVYNESIDHYRELNGIRSRNHPAPNLTADEAPFWVRKSLAGRHRAHRDDARRGLLPRALTLTLFARLCLGDFFIHGIGGGKYDEVTDQIIREYFHIESPAYQVLSATLHLPLPTFSTTLAQVRSGRQELRDREWNPQRWLRPDQAEWPDLRLVLQHKSSLIASEPSLSDHSARRRWFHDLQQVTLELRKAVVEQLAEAIEEQRRRELELAANDVLRRRDYPWILFPESTLRPFLTQFLKL